MATRETVKLVYFGLIACCCISISNAIVGDLVLDVYPYVTVGQLATYRCRSNSAQVGDPIFVWSIRKYANSSAIIVNNIPEKEYNNDGDPNDGRAESKVEFMVLAEYIGENLWCHAREPNEPATTKNYKGIPAQISLGTPLPTGGLGQRCNTDGSCNNGLLTCSFVTDQWQCVCASGYIQSGSECIRTVELGGTCVSDASCRATNSFCNTQNICQCKSGYMPVNGECLLQDVQLDDSCLNGQNCITQFSLCSSTTYVCVCRSDYYRLVVGESRTCQPKGSLGGTCTTGLDSCLTQFATCVTGTCTCNTAYYQINNACNPKATLGGTCTVGYDSCLTNHATCVNGQCVCDTGYIQSGTSCIPKTTAGLGESCDGQTVVCSVANSVCSTTFPRTCRCATGYFRVGDVCNPSGGIGALCSTSDPASCLTANSVCVTDTTTGIDRCVCRDGYEYVSATQTCDLPSLGSSCTVAVGCKATATGGTTTNPVCSNGVCSCPATYYALNGQCLLGGGIGSVCLPSDPASCLTANAECSSTTTRCVCSSGYTYVSSSQTCELPSLGSSCTVAIGCKATATGGTTANPVCSNGVCSCPATYYALNGQCLLGGGIGSVCLPSDPASCRTANAECSSTTTRCVCSSGYVYVSSTQTCDLPSLGQSCEVTIGCKATTTGSTTTNPQCLSGVCGCPTNYYGLDGQCIQKSGLGQTCNPVVSTSCSDSRALCVTSGTTSTCQCKTGFVNSGGVCVLDTSGDYCPVSAGDTTPRPGIPSPSSLSSPDVEVGSTCYEVNLFESVTMSCADTKKETALQYGGWERLVNGTWTNVVQTTISFINGNAAIPSVTVSNAKTNYAGQYRCKLCYGTGQTRCTTSEEVTLYVKGSQIASVTTTVSPNPPKKGDTVTLTCTTSPPDVATSYRWLRNGVSVSSLDVFTINNIQPTSDGTYVCEASNDYGTVSSSANPIEMSVQYAPVFSIAGGGDTRNVYGNLASDPITIECVVSANPTVQTYYFYDSNNQVLQSSSSPTYEIDNDQGYGTYSCIAENAIGRSQGQYFNVQVSGSPGVGAATEDSGLSTGTIVAIVLGIIFLLLLILIIIVCCCSYGWCRKKEKVQPQVIEQSVVAKPYIMRPVMSAGSTVSKKDVGILVKGHDFPPEAEEPHYMTPISIAAPRKHHIEPEERYTPSPRYYLKPATNGGPIISMYDDKYSQPRPLQLPALDTQYLYVDDDAPKKRRRRKKHRHERRDKSPRQSYYEPDPDQEDVENKYAEVLDAKSDDLVVIPGKQNYFE